jgi:[ribosomal protein S5]-alanine N-acetyltransferase
LGDVTAVEADSSALFDFAGFPELCTDRLVLREVTLEHAEDVFGFRGDYEVTKYNCGDAYVSAEQVKKLISSQIEDFAGKLSVRWGISLRQEGSRTGPVMGMVGFNYWDRTDHRASIGLELHQSLWGQGIMTEALEAVLRFMFERMGLNRVEASASVYNDKCIVMLKKMGFVQEGLQREQYYEKGEYHDLVLMALLRRDWMGTRS